MTLTNAEIRRRYKERHPDRVRAQSKKWQVANPEKARAWRYANREKEYADVKSYRQANPDKVHAWYMVDRYLESQPCEVCGAEDYTHAHHEDYSKPLDVQWLCPQHHKEVHSCFIPF